MDNLKAMEIFVNVVAEHSYAGAANKLGMSRANVTKYVMQLEQHLGARLLNRTTRRVSLTEVGEDYYGFCRGVLTRIQEKEAAISGHLGEPRGQIKIMVPKSFGGMYMGGVISRFRELHPEISLSLFLTDVSLSSVDLVEHGFDLAIRLSAQADSSLVARGICTTQCMLCASPGYIDGHGRPRGIKDLKSHPCLIHTRAPAMGTQGTWKFQGPAGTESVKVSGPLTVNSVVALRDAALDGLGIALLPTYCMGADLRDKTLIRLLPAYAGPKEQISVLFPHRRFLAMKSRLFIDFMAEYFRDPPWKKGRSR